MRILSVGTKSVLFGVHAFWFHPITVLLAWRRCYKSWPSWRQLIPIALHDVGYWGRRDIDGEDGKLHPMLGAWWSACVHAWLSGRLHPDPGTRDGYVYLFSLLHSKHMAERMKMAPWSLYHADKVSILYDPKWFYLLRAWLSGEIEEFKANAIRAGDVPAGVTNSQWFDFYRANVCNRPEIKELL